MCFSIDSVFVMWAIGGAFLGWCGMKAYRRYSGKKDVPKTNPNSTPDTVNQ